MSQRIEPDDSLDDFPTPPWAVRAFLDRINLRDMHSVWEPACGRGHMAQVLGEYFPRVRASDVFDYGYGDIADFPDTVGSPPVDWLITNPPFRLAADFFEHGCKVATRGVALLVRTVFLESVTRYNRIFGTTPPTEVYQYVERVPMLKGRLERKASTATGYAWLVWQLQSPRYLMNPTELFWIPPSRKRCERDSDYEPSFLELERGGA